jgi:hypothetical protein
MRNPPGGEAYASTVARSLTTENTEDTEKTRKNEIRLNSFSVISVSSVVKLLSPKMLAYVLADE